MPEGETQEVVISQDGGYEVMFDDVPEHTELRIVVKDKGEDSYVEYDRPDGSTRRLFTKKGGGPIRIRTERV